MRLLPEGSIADLADEGFLPGVDLEMLLEVEPFRVDQQPTDWAAFIIRPEQFKC